MMCREGIDERLIPEGHSSGEEGRQGLLARMQPLQPVDCFFGAPAGEPKGQCGDLGWLEKLHTMRKNTLHCVVEELELTLGSGRSFVPPCGAPGKRAAASACLCCGCRGSVENHDLHMEWIDSGQV